MSKSNGDEPSLLKRASIVAKSVQVENIFLQDMQVHRHFHGDTPPSMVKYGFNADTGFDNESRQINSQVKFFFSSFFDASDESTDPPLHVEITYCLNYSVSSEEEFEDSNVDAFGKMNAVYNAWPYIRECLQAALTRMGLPPFTLPVLRIEMLSKVYADKQSESGH